MPNYGLLAQQGRREDNAAMGGQVAHISALEAELLRLLGGAGTTNPVTGLPEYQYSGYGAAAYGGKGSGYGGTASFGGPGQSAAYGGKGPGGQAGTTGSQAGGGTGLSKGDQATLFNWNLAPEGPQSVTSETMTALQAEAKAKGGWGDAFMEATVGKGLRAYLYTSPIVNALEGVFGPGPNGPMTYLGEAIYGPKSKTGEGKTQTVTAAPPSISPTYAPTTGSISTPRLAQVIAEPPPEEEKEVAEAELFDLGFPESPLLAGQEVFEREQAKFVSPENLARYDLATQDVLLKYVADQLLQRAQTQGQLA